MSYTKKTLIPLPPHQTKEWKAPSSDIPLSFVPIIDLLFKQGLADPRGLEYRSVTVRVGNCWNGDSGVIETRGWVLPTNSGESQQFAICWNGLIYPVIRVNGKSDLKQDVRLSIQEAKVSQDRSPSDQLRSNEVSWLSRRDPSQIKTALLLRLGEGTLASDMWGANQNKSISYMSLADDWAWAQFDRALSAHMRGDDFLALYGFQQLKAFVESFELEATKQGLLLPNGNKSFFNFLDQLPDLIADQERRAKQHPSEPIVCIGPCRDSDVKKRIKGLIDRLDEVSARQVGQPGNIDLQLDPIITALIREGDAALEPLLECLTSDHRMTRSVYFSRDFKSDRTVLTVQEAAFTAINAILCVSGFDLKTREINRPQRTTSEVKRLIDQVHDYRILYNESSPTKRALDMLANEKATPNVWIRSAMILLQPEDRVLPVSTKELIDAPASPNETRITRVKGDVYRKKDRPSLTELFIKRIAQCVEVEDAARLSLLFAEWDSKASVPILAEQMKRCCSNGLMQLVVDLTETRHNLGDCTALADYAKWVCTVNPQDVKKLNFGLYYPFGPLWNHPYVPEIRQAAEFLFNNPKSPWVISSSIDENQQSLLSLPDLLDVPLLRLPGFRTTILKELHNKSGRGKICISNVGVLTLDFPGIDRFSQLCSIRDPQISNDGVHGTFRMCDYVAWKIGKQIIGAPRCELYWGEKERDNACLACGAFLRRFGDHICCWTDDLLFPRRDRPATRDEVQKGEAIFSFEGDGQSRLVELPTHPVNARWRTLRDHPFELNFIDEHTGKRCVKSYFEQDGQVYQAEEIFQGGKWLRYYGFVGSHCVSKVPAIDIEFPSPDTTKGGRREWAKVNNQIDARLTTAQTSPTTDNVLGCYWDANTISPYILEMWNRGGLDSPLPDLSRLKIHLYYSAAMVSRQGMLVPESYRDSDWQEIVPRLSPVLIYSIKHTLTPATRIAVSRFVVHDFYEIKKSGFYRLVVDFDEGTETEILSYLKLGS